MQSAVTICLVPEARQGPFVFHDGLEDGCRQAADAGFDAVEIFPGAAEELQSAAVRGLLDRHGLRVAAVGTGAGWVRHKLHLCHEDVAVRDRAVAFIESIVDAAAALGAPAIVGSMQGKGEGQVTPAVARGYLADALARLGERAGRHGQVLLYEPLNRYETNLFNRQAEAAEFLRRRGIGNVGILCDLFHMNIEEADMASAVVACGDRVRHVHWADSNRWAMGFGHTDFRGIVAALGAIGYEGFLSAEVFPLPTAVAAARRTIDSLREVAAGKPGPLPGKR